MRGIGNKRKYRSAGGGVYASAKELKAAQPSSPDGAYLLNVPGVGPRWHYCLLSGPNGGGWTMIMKGTRGTTFEYNSSYWTSTNTLNADQYNRNDGDAKFEGYNYIPGTDLLAIWPDVGEGNNGCDANAGYGFTWRDNGRLSNETARSWFGRVSNYNMGTPFNFCVMNTNIFSWQDGLREYNYNYTRNGRYVRWGFAWNNEGDHGSNDVSGGIGMNSPNFSAGDHYGCCGNARMNRTARFELYIR